MTSFSYVRSLTTLFYSLLCIITMSDAEDGVVVPWVGPGSKKNCLSIVVISSSCEIIAAIAEALTEMHSKSNYEWKLILHKTTRLEDMLRLRNMTGEIAIDLVVMVMDTSKVFCLEWARKNFQHINPDLKKRRVVLVNGSGLPVKEMKVDSADIVDFVNDNDLDLFSANVSNPEEAIFLADRLLRYLLVSVGAKTGVPSLNI